MNKRKKYILSTTSVCLYYLNNYANELREYEYIMTNICFNAVDLNFYKKYISNEILDLLYYTSTRKKHFMLREYRIFHDNFTRVFRLKIKRTLSNLHVLQRLRIKRIYYKAIKYSIIISSIKRLD